MDAMMREQRLLGEGPGEERARPLRLRTNFLWTFAGNVVYAGCQWLMLAVLAKRGTHEMVGTFALSLAITGPVFMLTNLNLRALQATDANRQNEFADYLSLRLIGAAAGFVLSVLIGIVGWGGAIGRVVLAMAAAKTAESMSDIVYSLLQQRERMDLVSTSMMVTGGLGFLTLATTFELTHSVPMAVAALATVRVVVLTTYDLKRAAWFVPPRAWRLPRDRRPLKRLLWAGLPLGIAMLLISSTTNIPRYFVEKEFGTAALGLLAALAYVTVAGNTVVSALGQSACPRLAVHFLERRRREFVKLFCQLIAISFAIGVASMLLALVAGRPILALLYNKSYADHVSEFVWLLGAGAVTYIASSVGFAMSAARAFNVQLPLFAVVVAVTIAVSALAIPHWAIGGAALALAVAMTVQASLGLLVVRRALRALPR